ncbi:MAG: hypothetical protein IKJ68_02385 [Clostridia bacterium]|nr:hypothetical protein [Clostridia bacterium]
MNNLLSLPKINLHIVGDSMADTYTPEQYPLQGWGIFLKEHFSAEIKVCNYARSGWSTKTFLTVGQNKNYPDKSYWEVIKNNFKEGDWLLVALGVNDCSLVNEFRVSEEEYEKNLTLFVRDAKDRGVNVIFMTPAIKGGDDNSENGWEYIAPPDGVVMDDKIPMEQRWVRRSQVLINIGAKLGVPVIELGKYLSTYYEKLYQEYMTQNPDATVTDGRNYVRYSFHRYNKCLNSDICDGGFGMDVPEFEDDSTHLHVRGAKKYASIIAKLISKTNTELAKYVLKDDVLPQKTLFIMGASKEALVKKEPLFPLQGWGTFMADNVKNQLKVKNFSTGGWSTQSYRTVGLHSDYPNETMWDVMKKEFKKGDWLLMTFGINDSSLTNSKRTTEEEFTQNIEFFTKEARELGVNVLYMTVAINGGTDGSEDGWDYILPPEGIPMDENVPMYQRWVRRSKLFRDIGKRLNVPVVEFGKFLADYYEDMYQKYMTSHPEATVAEGRNYVRYHFHIYTKNVKAPKDKGGWGIEAYNKPDDATHTNINAAREYAAIVSHLIANKDIELSQYMASLISIYNK